MDIATKILYLTSVVICLFFLQEYLISFAKAKKRNVLITSEFLIALTISFIPGVNTLVAVCLVIGMFY